MIAGLGQGILFEAPLIAIQSQVKQDDVATATATMAFVRNIAVSISVIVCGTIFQNSMTSQNGYLRAAGLPEDLLMQLDGENALANVALPRTLDNPAWERTYTTPYRTISAGEMFACWVAHDNLHLRQLVELRRFHIGTIAQPHSLDYAGDW